MSPKVGLTVGNYPNIVTGAAFQTTDYYTCAKNFQTGMTLTKFYSNSGECLNAIYRLIDDLNLGYVNFTGSDGAYWPNLMFFLGKVVAQDFAPFQYQCFLFKASFITYSNNTYNSFIDGTDLYTSALFNMLSVSLTIKTLTTNIIKYRDDQDYPNLFTNLGTLIRLLAFFKSSSS
jgi:hypothetical protein